MRHVRPSETFSAVLAVALALVHAGCGPSETPAPPPPAVSAPPAPVVTETTLAALAVPEAAHAVLALPARATGSGTAGHDPATRTWSAHFGKGEQAAQVQLGERDGPQHATLAFYGRTLSPGRHEIVPATDDSIASHAGADDGVFTVEVRIPGHDLRSVSGTVELETVDAEHVTGTVEVVLKEQTGLAPLAPPMLVRFDAAHDRFIEGWIENESAVRAQILARRHR